MSQLGKLTASWFSGTQELSLALLNCNFDFSLVKVESPLEYRGLGASLSSRRREAAEDGAIHVTARKLGALFEQALPPVPALFKAYGERCSQIAQTPAVNPKGTHNDGPFADYMGADGTSIWAAATSGPGAIGVHLLACMLARLWTGPEAISIWEEIILERKKQMRQLNEIDPSDIKSLAAAHIDLSAEQLSQWDASARAWLQTADKAMELKQLQFMLIANNVGLPISGKVRVYDGVLSALKIAMTTADNLVKGMPQSIQDGSSLLGLSAWHIYPDMLVLGKTTREVHQKDSLVEKGGILTIGLKQADLTTAEGVAWSLPLAHLRYYGEPVWSSRASSSDGSRLSFQNLMYVALGSAIATWAKYNFSDQQAIHGIKIVGDFLKKHETLQGPNDGPLAAALFGYSWFRKLTEAAAIFEHSTGTTRHMLSQLLAFGKRRGSSFLAPLECHPTPFFGLCNFSNFLSMLGDEENRIDVLRRIAGKLKANGKSMVIRYKSSRHGDLPYNSRYEYATAIPRKSTGMKRSSSGQVLQRYSHTRWFLKTPTEERKRSLKMKSFCNCSDMCNNCICVQAKVRCSLWCHCRKSSSHCVNSDPNSRASISQKAIKERVSEFEYLGERCLPLENEDIENTDDLIFYWRNFKEDPHIDLVSNEDLDGDDNTNTETFRILLGDPAVAAIFAHDYSRKVPFGRLDDLEIVEYTCTKGILNPESIISYFSEVGRHLDLDQTNSFPSGKGRVKPKRGHTDREGSKNTSTEAKVSKQDSEQRYYRSLRVLAIAGDLYARLPDATVSLGITVKELQDAKWATELLTSHTDPMVRYEQSRASAFSCITLFETGRIDLNPQVLESVMVVCAGNSLYVPKALQCDPWTVTAPSDIRLLVGNLGRSGISFLVPPPLPRMKELELGAYNLVNHAEFDGEHVNCFKNTTLHLSFTEYAIPAIVGTRGGRTEEAFFVESLISVHDRGEWIADLDVLQALESPHLRREPSPTSCGHADRGFDPAKTPLVAIDSWEEFLDWPSTRTIVRSHGNWLGQLAAMAMSVQRNTLTVLLPPRDVCWACSMDVERDEASAPDADRESKDAASDVSSYDDSVSSMSVELSDQRIVFID